MEKFVLLDVKRRATKRIQLKLHLKRIFSGLILLDTGSETTLANQLSIQGPKQNLTVQAVEEVRTTVKSH